MLAFLTKEKFLYPAGFGLALIAVIFWLTTSSQPLIDQHEFRQTQTAITSLFLEPSLKGLLNYETPVLGSAWSIPFEFPFYQLLAYALSKFSPFSLDSSGRLISSFFGLLCVAPVYGLMRLFQIKKVGRYWFLILYFSSPIYLYWNRTFMIESTALFFSLSSLYYYCKIRVSSANRSYSNFDFIRYLLFFSTLLLGLLSKVTTAAAVFMVISADIFFSILLTSQIVEDGKNVKRLPRLSRSELAVVLSILVLSFVILKSWLIHADSLKNLNLMGQNLTSEALNGWNFGQLSQRFDQQLWLGVVTNRMLNIVGIFPFLHMLYVQFLIFRSKKNYFSLDNIFLLICLFLFISPLLIFVNLHIVHSYYQCANQIFLLMAIAAYAAKSLDDQLDLLSKNLILVFMCLMVLGNASGMNKYLNSSLETESEKIEIGQFVQANTSKDDVIFVVGDDWSSAFSYHSKRRSLTLPSWQKYYKTNSEALDNSVEWLGGYRLGAIVEKTDVPEDAAYVSSELSSHQACLSNKMLELDEWKVLICS